MTTPVEQDTLAWLGMLDRLVGGGAGFASENPATGKAIARVRRATGADYRATVAAARADGGACVGAICCLPALRCGR